MIGVVRCRTVLCYTVLSVWCDSPFRSPMGDYNENVKQINMLLSRFLNNRRPRS